MGLAVAGGGGGIEHFVPSSSTQRQDRWPVLQLECHSILITASPVRFSVGTHGLHSLLPARGTPGTP